MVRDFVVPPRQFLEVSEGCYGCVVGATYMYVCPQACFTFSYGWPPGVCVTVCVDHVLASTLITGTQVVLREL